MMSHKSAFDDGMTDEKTVLGELKSIHSLLERQLMPATPAPTPQKKGFINEFKDFLKSYKVMGLATAFILALYLGGLVQALVTDLVMPIVTIFTPGLDWELIVFGPFRVGHFMGELITFIIIALVIFLIVKLTTKLGLQ